jgi:hypothetical protein
MDAYTTPAPMKQGQTSGGKSQPLFVNWGQVNHVEAEAEPGEPEIRKRCRLKAKKPVKKATSNKISVCIYIDIYF